MNDYVRATRPREPVEVPVRFETGTSARWTSGRSRFPGGRRHALVSRPRLLPAAVAALLSSANDGGPDGSAGERLREVWRGSGGAAVRPDAMECTPPSDGVISARKETHAVVRSINEGEWNGRLPPLMSDDGRTEVDPHGPTASKCQVGRAISSQANRRIRDED